MTCRYRLLAIKALSRVAPDVVPAPGIASSLPTMLDAVFLVLKVVGFAVKKQTVHTWSATVVLFKHVKGCPIHVDQGAGTAILLNANEHAFRGITAAKRKQEQVFRPGVNGGHCRVDVGTLLDSLLEGDFARDSQIDRVQVFEALPLFAHRTVKATTTSVRKVWLTSVVWVAIRVVAVGAGGSAVAANTSWRAVEQGHSRQQRSRKTVGAAVGSI